MSGKYDPDTRMGHSPKVDKPYYNPNDFVQISPKEIERQAKEVLETMKANVTWHEGNLKANQWKHTL